MKANSWLDEMVDASECLRDIANSINRYGEFGTRMSKKEFQMSLEGFEHLAHDTGAVITYNPEWSENHRGTGEAYFIYRGYRFFALWDKKGAKL